MCRQTAAIVFIAHTGRADAAFYCPNTQQFKSRIYAHSTIKTQHGEGRLANWRKSTNAIHFKLFRKCNFDWHLLIAFGAVLCFVVRMWLASDGDAWAKSFDGIACIHFHTLFRANRPMAVSEFYFFIRQHCWESSKNTKRIGKKRWRSGHARRNHCTRQCEKCAHNGTATASINYNWFQLILQLFLFCAFVFAKKIILLILNMHKHDYGTDVSLLRRWTSSTFNEKHVYI